MFESPNQDAAKPLDEPSYEGPSTVPQSILGKVKALKVHILVRRDLAPDA